MKTGVQPNRYDLRDFSFERTFGAVPVNQLPLEYNADLPLAGFPDQNKDGYPMGCTGYTQSEIGQDEIGILFDPAFVYKNALLISNLPDGYPVPVRNSFKATSIYGLKPREGDTPPTTYRRGKYFDVDKNGDYFDGIRSALHLQRLAHRTVSAGAPWYWGLSLPKDGIMDDFNEFGGASFGWFAQFFTWLLGLIGIKFGGSDVWHNFKICGWKMIKNEPYLIIKAWCGPKWGDKGYGYMSRTVCNRLFGISGTFLYTQANAGQADVATIKLDILELLVDLYRRLKALTASKPVPAPTPIPAPTPVPAPVEPPPAPEPAKPSILWSTPQNARKSVRIICDEEGLTLNQKNQLCATVGAESGWQSYYLSGVKKGQPVKLENKDPKTGEVWSTDWGICQINDHFHIGPGKSFPSVQYVLDNPEACIRWMCKQWKAGHGNWWIAFKNGSYKAFL